jgi:hypothetical protein
LETWGGNSLEVPFPCASNAVNPQGCSEWHNVPENGLVVLP